MPQLNQILRNLRTGPEKHVLRLIDVLSRMTCLRPVRYNRHRGAVSFKCWTKNQR